MVIKIIETRQKQKIVIQEALNFISKSINVCYKIIEYPDEIERNLPACDVLATIGRRNVAVEHTSIDSIPLQRRDEKRFIELLGPLKKELADKLPKHGHYLLVIPMNAIPTGINWADIRLRICEWCQKVAPTLEIGFSNTSLKHHYVRQIPQGVPFEITLYRRPGLDGQFRIGRFSPSDLENERTKVIQQALMTRGTKITKYKNSGFRTILVLESNDIALANTAAIGQAFLNSIEKIQPLDLPDEVYLIETELEPYYSFCLKFGDTVFPNVSISEKPYII